MKFFLACCALVCLAISALAQESPKSELFGGYSYIRTDEGDIDLNRLAGVPGTAVREGANLHGFNIAATYNLQKSFGFVADFGGSYGTIDYTLTSAGVTTNQPIRTNLYTFLFGPQFYIRKDNYALFARGMLGVARMRQTAFIIGQKLTDDEYAFAAGFGGGMDYHLNKKISARLFQADYILTRFEDFQAGDRTQGALRISTGLVFR